MRVKRSKPISILGGGLAGLFAAYHLKQAGFPVTVYEARDRIGGNCVTFRCGDFRLDSGAHRFHDKDRTATQTMRDLMGGSLRRTDAPSRIFSGGRFVDFPLSPLNLVKSLGVVDFARSTYQIARSRWAGKEDSDHDLKGYATRTYGSTIAERFLLNYSEKLWGMMPETLSSGLAKTRLKGLTIQGLLKEAILGEKAKTEHLDGAFYYPQLGMGAIADRLGDIIGSGNIRKSSRVTAIVHDGRWIEAIILNKHKVIDVDVVISTLPLRGFVELMEPSAGEAILAHAQRLRYRNLILVAFFLRKQTVTSDAVVYFPDKDFVFTRAYEPRNRSSFMAPAGRTSLVLEVPCDPGDGVWTMPDEQIVQLVLSQLSATGWVKPGEIMDTWVGRMDHAYPVVGVDAAEITGMVLGFLKTFTNLRVSGRNGRFVYCSIHDLMKESEEITRELSTPNRASLQTCGPSGADIRDLVS
jgi:protoporphyrinogen oxidase